MSLHSGECLSFHPCPRLLLTIDDLWLNSLDSQLSCPSTSPCDILLCTTCIALSILRPLSRVLSCSISVFCCHENTCQVPHRSNLTFIPAPVPIGSASVGDHSLPHCGEQAHISCAHVTTLLLHSGECLSFFPPPPFSSTISSPRLAQIPGPVCLDGPSPHTYRYISFICIYFLLTGHHCSSTPFSCHQQ